MPTLVIRGVLPDGIEVLIQVASDGVNEPGADDVSIIVGSHQATVTAYTIEED